MNDLQGEKAMNLWREGKEKWNQFMEKEQDIDIIFDKCRWRGLVVGYLCLINDCTWRINLFETV